MIRIAVIGCGSWGKNYVRSFGSLDGVKLVGLSDLSEQKLSGLEKRYPDAVVTTDYKDLLKIEDLDAVCIATEAVNHYTVARDALAAGKDVLVEKPLATRTDECDELVSLAASKDRILMVGHVFLYNKAVSVLKGYIDEGVLGKIYYIHATRTNLGPIRKDVNAIWDLAPHDISTVSYLVGSQPITVSASGSSYLSDGIQDMAFFSMKYPDDVVANIHVSWLYPRKTRETTIIGSKKMALFDDISTLEKIKLFDKGVMREPSYDSYGDFQLSLRSGDITIPNVEVKEPLLAECLHFLDCVKERKKPISDGVEGRNVVRVIEAVMESIQESGKPVAI
ncbi:MAG: Gfo/Idh/MocA family oxidoreductase [Candidatus Coatesbacteria bacterium]|nr:Gfo/Idh/MocA family oxidoreductase [Candidatus Coatesbacteria bacterium]